MKLTGNANVFSLLSFSQPWRTHGSWRGVWSVASRDRTEVTNMMGNQKIPYVGRSLVEMPRPAVARLSGEITRGSEIETHAAESTQFLHSGRVCLQSDNTVCMPDEVMFDIRRFDDRTAFKRQFILSLRRNPIVKPVSTLL